MRLGGEPVGRWGIALLAVAGIAGLLLAWHGWTGRAAAVGPSLAGGATPGSAAAAPAASSSPAASPSSPGAASPAPAASSRSGQAGPLLSSEPYASYAFQVWPGPVSATAKQAMIGLTVTVHKQATGLLITAGANGQSGGQQLYAAGARVYVVEASLGDDSGSSDYNLGDDGLVVTNAQGRIVQ